MKFPFRPKEKETDWDKELGPIEESRKQRLIRTCQEHDVSIHTDDESETSSGAYAVFRGTASEAELERRLNTKLSVSSSRRANFISLAALLISIIALIKSMITS
ncbi:hypothetical protein D3C84_1055030 [compost metagenome]